MMGPRLIFCSIMTIIFVAEIILEISALPSIRKAQKYDRGSFFYVSLSAQYAIFVYPPLIISSLVLLSTTFLNKYPIPIIIYNILDSLITASIMSKFFHEDSKAVKNFGIVLEILNALLLVFSIIYEIILIKRMKN